MPRMQLVDTKAIVKRLTKNCTSALEAAIGQCVNARHYEVTLEHLLLALLDDANSDIAFLVSHYDLDPSHLREYTDLAAFRALVTGSGLEIVALERRLLWFPLLDPLLFRIGGRVPGLASRQTLLRALRAVKVPILGYYALELVVERPHG